MEESKRTITFGKEQEPKKQIQPNDSEEKNTAKKTLNPCSCISMIFNRLYLKGKLYFAKTHYQPAKHYDANNTCENELNRRPDESCILWTKVKANKKHSYMEENFAENTNEENYPDKLLDLKIENKCIKEEENAETSEVEEGEEEDCGESEHQNQFQNYDRSNSYRSEQVTRDHLNQARKRLLELFMSQRNPRSKDTINQSSFERSLSNPLQVESLKESQIRMQQKIYDNIKRTNEVISRNKIDVYNLDKESLQENITDDGLPQRIIDSIITNIFYKDSVKSTDPSKLECNICCMEFSDGHEIKILQCLHTYHKYCIDEWFLKRSTCPDCKFNLRSLNVSQLY